MFWNSLLLFYFKCLEKLIFLVSEKPQVVRGNPVSVLYSFCYQQGK